MYFKVYGKSEGVRVIICLKQSVGMERSKPNGSVEGTGVFWGISVLHKLDASLLQQPIQI